MQRRDLWLWAGSLLAFSLAGCGGSHLASVTGKVTYDGEPVPDGEVTLIANAAKNDEQAVSGARIENGVYSIPAAKGVVVGTCRVEITGGQKTGKQLKAVPPALEGTMIDETEHYIPAVYNKASTLTAEIQSGSNEINFDLKKAP